MNRNLDRWKAEDCAGMTSDEDVGGRARADLLRAAVAVRVAVSALDRVVERACPSTVHPQIAMTLIESSQSAHRMLVMLEDVTQLLADPGLALLGPGVGRDN